MDWKGLTQQQVAEGAGIKQPTVSRLVNRKSMPDGATLLKIVAFTGGHVRADDFWLVASDTEAA